MKYDVVTRNSEIIMNIRAILFCSNLLKIFCSFREEFFNSSVTLDIVLNILYYSYFSLFIIVSH